MTTRIVHTGVVTLWASVVLFVFMFISAPLAQAQTATPIPLCEINRGLGTGMTGEDVECLQRYLNWTHVNVAASGPGSLGQETVYYGPLTTGAVIQWQNQNSTAVLAPLGLSSGTGFWGSSSFSHYVNIVRLALALR